MCTPQTAPAGPIRDALDFRGRFADGRMGSDPSLATPEKGARLIASAVDGLLREFVEFNQEPFIVKATAAR